MFFRVFENFDGSFTVIPYTYGDNVFALLMGIVFFLVMIVLVEAMTAFMLLPVVAILFGIWVAIYIPSVMGVVVALPLLHYGWAATCFVCGYASMQNQMGLIGIMGALVFTIIGAAALLPVGEEVGEFIAVMIIPILMILVATILYMIRYNVEKWVLYSFYIVAILAVVGIVLSIIDFINEYGGEKLYIFRNIFLGLLLVGLFAFLSKILPPVLLAVVLLLVVFAAGFLFALWNTSFKINHYLFMPISFFWLIKLLSFSSGIYVIMPFKPANFLIDLFKGAPFPLINDAFSESTILGFNKILSAIVSFIVDLIARIFDGSVDSFMMPEVFAVVFGFFLLTVFSSIGITVGEKVRKKAA